MEDQINRCPRCGEPARFVIATARVRCVLDENGEPGKVLKATQIDPSHAEYECGGGHRWNK